MEQITLDLIPKGSLPVLHASQYDDGRQWKVNLKENGEDYTLSDETIVLDVRKGDGCAVTCAVAVESGKKYVILTSTEQMCAVAGQNLAELQITKGNIKIGTLNFILQVERDPLNGSISSSSEIHDLQHQVDECVDNALADLGASGLPYDNTESGLEATNVQQAIDEVNEKASDLDSELDDKADKSSTYTKSEVNDIADTKADANNVYTKSEVYTKAETDSAIVGLIDDTSAASNKTWSGEKIDEEIINVLPTSFSSGSIAYFKTNIVAPLVRIVADVNATKVYQRGANFWDEESELGNLDGSTGLPTTDNNRLRSKNYCPIKEGLNFYVVKGGSGSFNLYFYDTNKAFISKTGWAPSGRIITTPTGTCYFKIVLAVQYGTTYNHDVGVLFPSSQTNYEAYKGSEYAVSDLSDIITLKGVNNLFADVGDVEECEFKTDISNNYIKKEINDNTRAIEANCYNLYPALDLDGYVNSSGIIIVDPTAKRTDYINIVGYTTVIAVTSINSTGYAIAFFDENQHIISGVLGDGAKTYTATIPVNAHFVIISQYGYPSATVKIINEGNLEEQIDAIRLDYIDKRAAFSAFAKFGVCGDSLSVGHTQDASGTNYARNIYYSWGQYIARNYGNVCLNFGKSGMTAKRWMSDDKCYDRIIVADNKCQCYIIGLGANDAENLQNYSDGIGTTDDIDFNDMSNNADSFCGWYAKIINTINTLNPTAIVFLLTLGYPRETNANVKSINQAIVDMAELAGFSNVILVDLRNYNDYLKKGLFGQIRAGHFSALGYANVARIIEAAISDTMNAYDKDTLLFEIPFIPYGSNNVLD